MSAVPVRVRVGCHVTTLGELEVGDNDAETYARLADILAAAAADLRERVIPEVLDG